MGETLVLDSVLACAAPRWDVVPDMQKNFAVEATIKLFEWPMPDWKGGVYGANSFEYSGETLLGGSIVSQHGSGTGWELRCGGRLVPQNLPCHFFEQFRRDCSHQPPIGWVSGGCAFLCPDQLSAVKMSP